MDKKFLTSRLQQLDKLQEHLKAKQKQLDTWERGLQEKQDYLQLKEIELESKQAQIQNQEEHIEMQWESLRKEQTRLVDWEESLRQKEKLLFDKSKSLQNQKEQVDELIKDTKNEIDQARRNLNKEQGELLEQIDNRKAVVAEELQRHISQLEKEKKQYETDIDRSYEHVSKLTTELLKTKKSLDEKQNIMEEREFEQSLKWEKEFQSITLKRENLNRREEDLHQLELMLLRAKAALKRQRSIQDTRSMFDEITK